MKTKTYFWDEFNIPDEHNYIKTELLYEKYFVSLLILYGMYVDKYIPDCNDAITLRSPINKDKFLTYLLPLLREGKLKVKIHEWELRLHNEEEYEAEKKYEGKDVPNTIAWLSNGNRIFDRPEQAQQAIDMIREKWNTFPLDFSRVKYEERSEEQRKQAAALDHFESWGVLFTLPENEWAI